MAIIMKMNKRYVGDINMATQAAPLKMRYKEGKTNVDERSVAEDERINGNAIKSSLTLPKEGFSLGDNGL